MHGGPQKEEPQKEKGRGLTAFISGTLRSRTRGIGRFAHISAHIATSLV